MPIAIYPRLGELLRARGMSLPQLAKDIEARLGVAVDRRALQRLTHAEPVRRTDLDLAGAAAAVLGVDLGALFDVEATPIRTAPEEEAAESADLDPEQSRRLAELFDRQARSGLGPDERAEVEALVAEYGRRLRERLVRERAAQKRGGSLDTVRRGAERELEAALAWWKKHGNDAKWRAGLKRSPRQTGEDEA